MAVFHRGENVFVVGHVDRPLYNTIDLREFQVYAFVTDFYGERVLTLPDDDPDILQINEENNDIILFIGGEYTAKMSGIYFVSYELWFNGQKLVANELENFEIIK